MTAYLYTCIAGQFLQTGVPVISQCENNAKNKISVAKRNLLEKPMAVAN